MQLWAGSSGLLPQHEVCQGETAGAGERGGLVEGTQFLLFSSLSRGTNGDITTTPAPGEGQIPSLMLNC